MRVAKWGNSLAVRIPTSVVEVLDLKEGDDIEINVVNAGKFEIAHDDRRQRALERIRATKWTLPEGWSFDRDEANAR